ncbi:MAG: hypothetical protein WDZ59_16725 [Pirellulales bacterium]
MSVRAIAILLATLPAGCALAPPEPWYGTAEVMPLPPVAATAPFATAPLATAPVAIGPPVTAPFTAAPVIASNPLFVPVGNYDFAWDQLVDVVDDYFRIDTEQRVQPVGSIWTDGRLESFPQGGATYLEPHRLDSIGRYNRLESTLQSIRRIATLRATPADGGLMVEVIVEKQLENVPLPEHATAGAATFRSINSVDDPQEELDDQLVDFQQWIPQGRDLALEQQILAEIAARLGGSVPVPFPGPGH